MSGESCDGCAPLTDHAIIAGFGVPGRAVAELFVSRGIPFCVIELNPQTVRRCSHIGVHIISGDVCDEMTLRRAGVERAATLVVAVPNDGAVLEAVRLARMLNPSIQIHARCRFISNGMEAHRLGADHVVIEEQIVAREITQGLEASVRVAQSAHSEH